MKILLATHFFPPGHPGGTEAYTLGLARTLLRMGHAPYVICAEKWGEGNSWVPTHEDTVYEGIPVRRLFWNWNLAPDPFVNFYDNPEAQRHFGDYLKLLRPDVVHATSCYSLGAGVISAAQEAGVPIVLTLTDFWFLCPRHTLYRTDGTLCTGVESSSRCQECLALEIPVCRRLATLLPPDLLGRALLTLDKTVHAGRYGPLRGHVGDASARLRFLKDAFSGVDIAIAPSKFLMETLVSNGFPRASVFVSRHGLEASWKADLRTGNQPLKLRLGYIGQIEPIKGVDVLVKAFRLLPEDANVELRIHGDLLKNRDYGQALVRLVARDPRIRFMGPFERPAIASVMSEIDVVVVPSVWYENSPLVISEAHAARRPVIASNLGGMSEMVDHEVDGLLFEAGNAAELSEAIHRLVEEPSLYRMLQEGIGPVRSMSEEVEGLLGLYSSLMRLHEPERKSVPARPAEGSL